MEASCHPFCPPASLKGSSTPSCSGCALAGLGAGSTGDAGPYEDCERCTHCQAGCPGARRVMPVLLRVPKTGNSPGAGALLLGRAVLVPAHLCRLFFSHPERHTPLPARAAPALPAPAAIIRRAVGVQRSRALPWVSRHPRGEAGWVGWCWTSVFIACCQPRGTEAVLGQHPLLSAASRGLPPWDRVWGSSGQRG